MKEKNKSIYQHVILLSGVFLGLTVALGNEVVAVTEPDKSNQEVRETDRGFNEADVDLQTRSLRSEATEVRTFAELQSAMADATTEHIIFKADIQQGNTNITRVSFGNKNMLIDGNGFKLEFSSANWTGFNFKASGVNNLTFHLKNITLVKGKSATNSNYAKQMFDFDANKNQEYRDIIFENINVPSENQTALVKVNNSNSKVKVIGKNSFHNSEGYRFASTTSGRNAQRNAFFNVGNIEFNGSDTTIDMVTDFIYQSAATSTLDFVDTTMTHKTNAARFIYSYGNKLEFNNSVIDSYNTWDGIGNQRESDIYLESNNAEVILKESDVTLSSTQTSVLQIAGENVKLLIDKSNFNINFDESVFDRNGTNAAIRFINPGAVYEITNGSKLNFIKKENTSTNDMAGGSSTIRMVDGGNKFMVSGGSTLNIMNGGAANDSRSNYNQALEFGLLRQRGERNSIVITDPDSQVNIVSLHGAAVTSAYGSLDLSLTNRATFTADGTSGGDNVGIFNINNAFNMLIDSPMYFDFLNRRPNGAVIQVGGGSGMASRESGLTWWQKNMDVNGSPMYDFQLFNYELTGNDLASIVSSSISEFNQGIYKGQSNISRMSSNNGSPELDYFRPITNADKRILGKVKVPVGPEKYRAAFNNEVKAGFEHNGATVEKSVILTKDKVDLWGESIEDGIFVYNLNDFAKTGEEYRLTNLSRATYNEQGTNVGSGRDISTSIDDEVRRVVDMTPPEPAKIDSPDHLSPRSSELSGEGEAEALVSVTINGVKEERFNTVVSAEGKWTIPLPSGLLKADDELQVFLQDRAGNTPEITDAPSTHNEIGNINPKESMAWHDAVFPAATKVTVNGGLSILSVPENIDFGEVSITDYQKQVGVDKTNFLTPIIIEDTSKVRNPWVLKAQVVKEMTNDDDVQVGALRYVSNQKELTLNETAQTIYQVPENETKLVYNISDEWSKGDEGEGLKLKIASSSVPKTTGSYEGTIKWSLYDVSD